MYLFIIMKWMYKS